MSTDHFNQIIPAGAAYEFMFELSQMAGWNQTPEQLQVLTSKHPESNLLAVGQFNNRKIQLGTGLVVDVGNSVAWISMILVHPDFRRRGIASDIMKQCIRTARQRMKCSMVGLDATTAGQQVYINLGFKSSFRLWRCIAATRSAIISDQSLKIAPIDKLDDCLGLLDEIGTGHMISWLALVKSLNPDYLWAAKFNGEVVGLIMSRPGWLKPFIGPLVAKSLHIAQGLLSYVLTHWNNLGFGEVFIDIPERHFKQASVWKNEVNLTPPTGCLLNIEITASRPFVRMYQTAPDHGPKVAETGHKEEGTNADSTVFTQTIECMAKEKNSLEYLFATGGPEIS